MKSWYDIGREAVRNLGIPGIQGIMKPLEELRESQTWVFDLDNTLYPASCGLIAEILSRMIRFVANTLDLDPERALVEQKRTFREHGTTTLRGLMNDHDVDPIHFMDFVHDVDYSVVGPMPRLNAALSALPGRKVVFTNASTAHADTVLRNLGINAHFDGIFDVAAADYVPKSDPRPYAQIADRHDFDPAHAVMLEDIGPNLALAACMGMTRPSGCATTPTPTLFPMGRATTSITKPAT